MRLKRHRDGLQDRAILNRVRARNHGELPNRPEEEVERDQALAGRGGLAFKDLVNRIERLAAGLGQIVAAGQARPAATTPLPPCRYPMALRCRVHLSGGRSGPSWRLPVKKNPPCS